MTHEKALEAAAQAVQQTRRDVLSSWVCPTVTAKAAITAYLAAYGVGDLEALVDAARGAMFDLRALGHEATSDALCAALTAPSPATKDTTA